MRKIHFEHKMGGRGKKDRWDNRECKVQKMYEGMEE